MKENFKKVLNLPKIIHEKVGELEDFIIDGGEVYFGSRALLMFSFFWVLLPTFIVHDTIDGIKLLNNFIKNKIEDIKYEKEKKARNEEFVVDKTCLGIQEHEMNIQPTKSNLESDKYSYKFDGTNNIHNYTDTNSNALNDSVKIKRKVK